MYQPIPVALRTKAKVCSLLIVGIASSIPTGEYQIYGVQLTFINIPV